MASRGRGIALTRSSVVRWVFLRALGVVYHAAFRSLRGQVLGLYGERGILPVRELLGSVGGALGPARYRVIPSLFWLDSSPLGLHVPAVALAPEVDPHERAAA